MVLLFLHKTIRFIKYLGLFLILANYTVLSYQFVQIFTIVLIVAIRTFAVRFRWKMPKFYAGANDSEM